MTKKKTKKVAAKKAKKTKKWCREPRCFTEHQIGDGPCCDGGGFPRADEYQHPEWLAKNAVKAWKVEDCQVDKTEGDRDLQERVAQVAQFESLMIATALESHRSANGGLPDDYTVAWFDGLLFLVSHDEQGIVVTRLGDNSGEKPVSLWLPAEILAPVMNRIQLHVRLLARTQGVKA